jgi:hypothetical protein
MIASFLPFERPGQQILLMSTGLRGSRVLHLKGNPTFGELRRVDLLNPLVERDVVQKGKWGVLGESLVFEDVGIPSDGRGFRGSAILNYLANQVVFGVAMVSNKFSEGT